MGGVPLCKAKQTAKVMVYEMLFMLHSVINSLTDVESGEQKSFVYLTNYLWHLLKLLRPFYVFLLPQKLDWQR